MYNPFVDNLPTEYKGIELKTDFKQVFKFFALQEDDDFDEQEKAYATINIFFDGLQEVIDQEVFDFLGWYIRAGEEPSDSNEKQIFDWLEDSEYLYSAFYQTYKIDLLNVKMHWWQFLSLYKGLPDNTKLAYIIQTRATKVPKRDKYNADYVNELQKQKKYYALHKKTNVDIGKQIADVFNFI